MNTRVQPEHGERFWDGVKRSYIPSQQLDIDPALTLHTEANAQVDPITYEVVRNALVQINYEHGALLQRLCISPVVVFSRDYQTTILDANGDLVVMGPNIQYFANCASLIVKWILEFRGGSPGIRPGDLWLCNDPYIGNPHQPDVCIAAPVFVGDQLFGWVCNLIHNLDLGGGRAGGQNPAAVDTYQEAISFPPFRIAEAGVPRADLIDLFVRQSRVPLKVRTDLMTAMAVIATTREKYAALIARYGAGTVRAVIAGTQDAGEALFAERLAQIPDGCWSHRLYTEVALPGDRGVYAYQINLIKRGGELIVTNEGSDPQAGSLNLPFGPFSGAVLAALTGQLASDLAGTFGGVYRRVHFELTPGLISCPEHPGAVSPSGAIQTMAAIYTATIAVGKMLTCGDDGVRDLALGASIPHFYACAGLFRSDSGLRIFGNADGMIGALGAMPTRDGIEAGGHFWIPQGIAANIEDYEEEFPMLFLYRRYSQSEAAGAGRLRGGFGFEEAIALHGAQSMQPTTTMNENFAKSQAPWGGNPGARAWFRVQHGASVHDALASGRVPRAIEELPGTGAAPGFRGTLEQPLTDGDVFAWNTPTTAGWGDPLHRDPHAVANDVRQRLITRGTAERVYGVSLGSDGAPDSMATQALRASLFAARLGHAPTHLPNGETARAGDRLVGDAMYLREGHFQCRCGTRLCAQHANYKLHAVRRERAMSALGAEFCSADVGIADQIVLREFFCPGCGTRLDTELVRQGDELLHDIYLD